MPAHSLDEIHKAFHAAVNMTAEDLEDWLERDASRMVGWTPGVGMRPGKTKSQPGGPESIGHRSGRRIVGILRAHRLELTDDDYAHMRKVVGYIRRHLAQRPRGDVSETRWRYSLMNWGHDPLHD